MATPFENAVAKLNAAVRASNGEPVHFAPMLPARAKSALPDPSRDPRTVTAVFLQGPERTAVTDNTLGRELNTRHVVAPTSLIVHRSELLIDGLFVELKRGDRAKRIEHPESGLFEITAIEPNGSGDFVVRLVKVDA